MNLDDLYFKDNFTKEGNKVDLEINKLTAECISSKNNAFRLDNSGNLNVHSITTEVPIVTESKIDVLYPIGSIYMNVNPINPDVILGGSWEKIKDRFLLASGDHYINNAIGGEATHQLTLNEMPSHNHGMSTNASFTVGNNKGTGISGILADVSGWGSYKNADWYAMAVDYNGGNLAHNNMPPYLVVNVWKRIA